MGLIKKGGTKGLRPAPEPPDDSTRQFPTGEAHNQQAAPPSVSQSPTPVRSTVAPPLPTNEEESTRNLQSRAASSAAVAPSPPDSFAASPPHSAAPPAPSAVAGLSGEGAGEGPQVLAKGAVLQGRYHIDRVLGVGGMSVVYLGLDMRFDARKCAIKEMFQTKPNSQTRLLNFERFKREANLLASFSHPAIPKVYDFFEEFGHCYLVMELIPGKDLEMILDEEKKPIDYQRVVRWTIQICDVLRYLHGHQPRPIVFRDMKPSNVLLTPDDRIVLVDFGIARIFTEGDQKGTMIGTEGYAPPEQYRGIAEPQGDIYALGATMHHLLTNDDPRLQTPFTFQDRPIRKLNPAVPAAVEAVVVKALEYEMGARWQSADEMKQALQQAAGIDPSIAAPAGTDPNLHLRNVVSGTQLVWRFPLEEEVRSSPTVGHGLVFVGCYDTNLYAIDAERGEFRWKYATEGGISSSPSLWQDMVIVGSEDGFVYALDIRRGTLRWRFQTGGPVRSSPRIYDRVVVVGSDDRHLYAIDGIRGKEIWRYRAWSPFRSSAKIVDDSVFIGCDDGNVYSIDLTKGKLKWKQRTRQPVISSPTYYDGLIFVGSADFHLYALDGGGGFPVWKYRTGSYVNSSPAVDGQRVFVGSSDGVLYALDIRKGRTVWHYETESQIASSPTVEGGRVYFGAANGNIYCLDANSGSVIWEYATDGPVVSSPAVVDGILYIGSLDQHVYALKA